MIFRPKRLQSKLVDHPKRKRERLRKRLSRVISKHSLKLTKTSLMTTLRQAQILILLICQIQRGSNKKKRNQSSMTWRLQGTSLLILKSVMNRSLSKIN